MKLRQKIYTTKDTVPPSSAETASLTSSGDVFTTASAVLALHDMVWNETDDELLEVIKLDRAGTSGQFDKTPSTAFSADTSWKVVKWADWKGTLSVSIASPSGGAVPVIDEDGNSTSLPASTSLTVNSEDTEVGVDVRPVIVDGTSNNPTVAYPRFKR